MRTMKTATILLKMSMTTCRGKHWVLLPRFDGPSSRRNFQVAHEYRVCIFAMQSKQGQLQSPFLYWGKERSVESKWVSILDIEMRFYMYV